ncbi:DnaJ domain-containing protein [Saccharicrinis carchari]|uniref:DnaJ domain-containing protein n=1 Tax=Saccharicrinis carchari TaxID=1168039 RepID=A0A521B8C8_SACCC|nr:J domain-containing protein [Saccharicrinis carchari]SMO43372.1 DnaJ domain-containing protein [Saccharicrinis carchari]
MNDYYHILGVTPHATLEQIKKAYRKKAKLYHPDVNKAVDAHERFILVNEAYEYLLNVSGNNVNRIKRNREKAQKQAAYQQQWEKHERQKARERAREYARMKYEAYLNSDIYRTTEAINVVVDFFITLFILTIVILLPILSFHKNGAISLVIWLIIIVPSFPLWFRFVVRTWNSFSIRSFFYKKQSTIKTRTINILVLFVINVVIFFKIVLNTLITLNLSIGLYAIAIAIGFMLARLVKRNYYKYMLRINVAPGVLGLFFLLNYAFSRNPVSETYWYSYNRYQSKVFYTVLLEDGVYNKYPGIRTFAIEDGVQDNNRVTYEFQEGLFGLRVAKHIYLYYELP